MEIVITGTTVTVEGDATIGFALNNLVNTLTATTDQSEEWNYTLTVHMIVQDVYNVINLNRSGQTLSVDLTADMLPYSGRYEMQFVATNGDYVSHTDIFEVFVKNTLDPVKQYTPVPSEFYQIQKNVQQNAQLAQNSANQAEQSATDAEGYATQAQQSAQDASGYLAQVQESANKAAQSAAQAADSATQAAQSAQTAQTAVDSIGNSVQQAQTAANNAQQSATQAGTSATQAQESATQAQGYATTAGNSATSAQQSATSAQQSVTNAEQSATQAQTSATQASTSATQASESETNAAESATQAQQSASAAQQSATSASESASEASTSAQQAASSATAAQNAQQAIENMRVSATTLAPGSDASVTKTTDQGVVNLLFGIPQGEKGDAGLGVPVPTVDDANDVPVVNSTGTAYELQPYTNNNAVGANPWSSKQIVDSFCPPFTTSGSVVTCTPVPGYPLHVVSQIVPVQEGEGDPSPDNVRPIRGWDEANLWVAGKNLWDNDYAMNPDNWENGTYYALRLPLAPNATYTLSMSKNNMFKNYNPDYNGKFAFHLGEIPYQAVGNKLIGNATVLDVPLTYTFSTSDKPMYANLYSGTYGESGFEIAFTELLVNLQIEAGSTPTPYTPYNPASKTITLPFGQTVYGGTLDWTTGVLTVDWISHTFNAADSVSGNWQSTDTSMGAIIGIRSPGATPVQTTGEIPNVLCASLKTISYGNIFSGSNSDTAISRVWGGEANQFAIRLPLSLAETAADIKSWLIDNAIEVVYQIATPITIQLTPTEILALSGTNTIYADTGDTTVSGRQNLINYLQSLSSAVLGG